MYKRQVLFIAVVPTATVTAATAAANTAAPAAAAGATAGSVAVGGFKRPSMVDARAWRELAGRWPTREYDSSCN